MEFNNNFGILSPNEADTLDEPYDFDSIMHYKQLKGSKNRFLEPLIRLNGHIAFKGIKLTLADISTIVPKKRKGIVPEIGQRKRLSVIDIRKTNKLYECPKCGRTYFDQKATFTSPEYYSKSTHRAYNCEWRITVMDGESIRLKINDSNIFKSNDCKSDYLEIRDGY